MASFIPFADQLASSSATARRAATTPPAKGGAAAAAGRAAVSAPGRPHPFPVAPRANDAVAFVFCGGDGDGPMGLAVDALAHPISSSVRGVAPAFRALAARAGRGMVDELARAARDAVDADGGGAAPAAPAAAAGAKTTVRLHTADVVRTSAGALPHARHLLHVVTPAYTAQYKSAMINSLNACYRHCLEQAVECGARTVGFSGMEDRLVRGGYDRLEAMHVALRTVRRFLVRYPGKLDRVVFACTGSEQEVLDLAERVAPLYFPRTQDELHASVHAFTKGLRATGDAHGAHTSRSRRIRIGGAVLAAGACASPVVKAGALGQAKAGAARSPPPSASKYTLREFPRLDVWPRGKICLRVRDTHTAQGGGEGSAARDPFTLYEVRIGEGPGTPGYTVWRRYSEFRALREAVLDEATAAGAHATLGAVARARFPGKVWFGSMDPEVVAERKVLLDGFLRSMSGSADTPALALVRAFCTPTDADAARYREEEEEDEEEDEEDEEWAGPRVPAGSAVPRQATAATCPSSSSSSSSTGRTVLGKIATNVVKKTVARPDHLAKIRRNVKRAASGKDAGYDAKAAVAARQGSKHGRSRAASEASRRATTGGARLHRARSGSAAESAPGGYKAEGNRFISNDDL